MTNYPAASSSFRRSNAGFSLIELLVVVAVIMIVVAVAVPNGIRRIQLHRLDSSVSLLSTKLMEARMNAIKRNRSATLHINRTGRFAQIRSTDDASTPNVINVGIQERFAASVDLDAAGDVNVVFDSMGRLAAAQTITLIERNSGRTKVLTVSLAGRVNVGAMN